MKRGLLVLLSLLFLIAMAGSTAAQDLESAARPSPVSGAPIELALRGAGDTDIDLRALPEVPPRERER